jgi:BirA family transcriptional regulator, biotin operon repressor / biotin---[acetyl-CoA-carboxylase] ligase
MTTPTTVWNLDTARIGRCVIVYDVVDSTNNLAAALSADPANDGIAVLAGSQTAGRGQHGRTWQTPAGSAVLLSVLCFPPPHLRRAAVLTAWAAVAVCETVRQTIEMDATIKWPNDVLVDGRKVCGILTEQNRGTVVGIGLNVNQAATDFATAGLAEATSLRALSGQPFECADVARSLLRNLDAEYERLLGRDLATLEEKWRAGAGLLGRHVEAECADGVIRGRLLEMTFDGVLLDIGSEIRLLAPEMVRHIQPI